jgi:hypothetical protein
MRIASVQLLRFQPRVELAVACDTERDRSWMCEATRVEQGTEQRDTQQSSNEVFCCVQAAGYRQREQTSVRRHKR